MAQKDIAATGNIKLGNLKVTQPETYGAGAKGVITALRHLQKERGLINSIVPLAHLNQKKDLIVPVVLGLTQRTDPN